MCVLVQLSVDLFSVDQWCSAGISPPQRNRDYSSLISKQRVNSGDQFLKTHFSDKTKQKLGNIVEIQVTCCL